ncbi:MAG TPA: hypothetical protein VHC47_06460, partial [Mucilaginibacter sp.]|nr:hypothetical protein [Mucilaginibacter sp.]
KITKDSIYYYRNDTLQSSMHFVITKAKPFIGVPGVDSAYFIHFIPQSLDKQVMAATSDSLSLADAAYDAYGYGYVRHK